jgi:Tfp pilus assembly protein PilX
MTMQPKPLPARVGDEHGVALVIALFCMLLMMALGMSLMSTTMTETRIAGNYTGGTEALYAADAAVERVMQDLLTVPDWNNILNGTLQSSFVDGPPNTARVLPDGTTLNLGEATNMVRCGKTTACTDAQMDAISDERPWGPNNPRWQIYAYGAMENMLPTDTINSNMYVVVWVADDPSENDNLPTQDGKAPIAGTGSDNPGRGVLAMLAHAYGPQGVRRVIEVTVARTDTTEIERGYTGQRGQDEQNRRARKAAVQTPGKALTRSVMGLASGGLALPN